MNAPHDGLLVSADYWGAFAVYAVTDRALHGLLPARVHHLLTAIASAAFLWWFTSIGTKHLFGLYGAILLVYAAANIGPRIPRGLLLVVGSVVVLWMLGKIGSTFRLGWASSLFFLGVSFLIVKIWTFAKDLRDGRIEQPDVITFVSYCTYFPCFVAGPMHFYGEYREGFEKRTALDGATVIEQFWRVLHGLVKVLVVARLLRPFGLEAIRELGISQVGPAELVLRSAVYSLVIYADFSGYSDIVIASTRLAGVSVPENFQLPYFARNLRDFWQRWHITFTRFLTRYIFVPVTRALQGRLAKPSPAKVAAAGYVVTFAFCGVWHGSTPNYLAWGLYHGLGLTVYDAFNRGRMAKLRQQGRVAPARRWSVPLFAAFTFLFVSVGWTLFILPVSFWAR